MTDLVSVVMATYNGERFVGRAVESVLAQSHGAVELLVCDDGSRDGTVDVLRGFGDRIRLIQQENQGVSAARNHASAGARGAFISFLDQDDAMEPDLLELQLAALSAHPEWGCVYADSWVVDADGVTHGKRSEHLAIAGGQVFDALLDGNFIPIETLVMRSELFRAIGGFRVDLALLEDWELCLRAARRAPIGYTSSRPLARYRVHDTNLSHDAEGLVAEYEVVLQQMLAGTAEPSRLTADERDHVARALANRRAELAWYALRRGDLPGADSWRGRIDAPCRPGLAMKVRALRALLGVVPAAWRPAVLRALPRRRLYGR